MQFLLALALLPAVVLLIYIYRKDKLDREPMSLILKLLALGAVSCLPAAGLEYAVSWVITQFGVRNSYFSAFLEAFAVAALCEELLKFIFLRVMTWNNPDFDYQFDAIVYAVTVSLGFAALENVLYVLQSGFATGVLRAVTSVPGHAFFGVFMGYFYGFAKLAESQGRVTEQREYLALSFLVPILLHGVYDFIAFAQEISGLWLIPFFGFVVLMYVLGLRRVNRSSADDRRIVTQRSRYAAPEAYPPAAPGTTLSGDLTGVYPPSDRSDGFGTGF